MALSGGAFPFADDKPTRWMLDSDRASSDQLESWQSIQIVRDVLTSRNSYTESRRNYLLGPLLKPELVEGQAGASLIGSLLTDPG
jgi:hypothetical protein